MSNQNYLSKEEVFEFQKTTLDRIANYVYDLEDTLSEGCTNLAGAKKEVSWTRKAIEVELEGIVAIIEEFHKL
jgi:hypothetical protein|tara:strand:- start:4162 stop:4380 length:219 start_codon:yes stop_codon:yes gene_type:complete